VHQKMWIKLYGGEKVSTGIWKQE